MDDTPNDRRGKWEGSIVPRQRAKGRVRYLVRVKPPGQARRAVGTFDTREEAQSVLNGTLELMHKRLAGAVDGHTLITWWDVFYKERIEEGVATAGDELSLFRTHITEPEFAKKPLPNIEKDEVQDWILSLKKKKAVKHGIPKERWPFLSRQSRKHILKLVRRMLAYAMRPPHRLIKVNVADAVVVDFESGRSRGAKRKAKKDLAKYLSKDEILRLKSANIDDPEIWIIMWAIGTCTRFGEQMNLELKDVHMEAKPPFVDVKYSAAPEEGEMHDPDDEGTKSGNIVRVPLFGLGLEAMQRWLEILPTYCKRNELGLVFAGRRGGRRTKAPNLWYLDNITWHRKTDPNVRPKQALARAGIRDIRWHDLRHTGASALLSGYWGRRWTLQEISKLLNHANIGITQRYAKFTPQALEAAATEAEEAYVDLRPLGEDE